MDNFKCNGRCYQCSGCEELESQMFVEIIFSALGINCETTREKMELSLAEAERLSIEIARDDLTEYEKIPLRAHRLKCHLQFGDLVRVSNIVEWKIKKYKEQLSNGADTNQ